MGLLDGRVAIVTGAARGLGRAHALGLASEGAFVVVNDPGVGGDGSGADSTPAELVVAEIEKLGGRAVANLDSCADWAAAEGLVAQAVETFGSLDILVNNAGILRDKMSFNLTEDDWDSVINVHLKGHFAPSRFAAAHWRARAKAGKEVYGRIVNTSSESGYLGLVGQVNYATAKAGIVGMTAAMARELERIGVTVNAISPRARTRMTTSSFANYGQVQEGAFDDRAPENVSPLVVWLASPAAAHVSGQLFTIYGGDIDLKSQPQTVAHLSVGDRRWAVEDLLERSGEFFSEGHLPGVPPLPAGIGGQ
ncbi:SDR family NAD(P)-dependent oxidoreductase [Mycobacterium sp. UM_CSW]|uniref:SDR family NAD(P)-dependent oxidoreductase n=1 Tax=Mycobacterium sp. UM_CSW TaxID=1370119 RepID=UPI0004068F6C|nr:SDR family NAD(P)-dependent oxidoreductase [Mycobacterium sp. UM_CSW]